MPESASETLESDVKLCKAHGHWAEEDGTCFECVLERVERSLEGCTVYRLYRDPLFEDAPLVPPGVTFFGPMAHYT
jgi:hypothetical protein